MTQNFLDSSSIHGFKYLSSRFHWIERIFWIISLIFSAVCTTFLIFQLVIKIKTFPIVTYSSESPIKITDIDLPAATICSGLASKILNSSNHYYGEFSYHGIHEQTSMSLIFYYEEFRKKLAMEDHKIVGPIPYYELLQKIERNEVKIEDLNERIIQRLHFVDLVTRQGIFERLKLSVPTDNFLYAGSELEKFSASFAYVMNILYQGKFTLVSQIMTEHGFCFTFNLATPESIYNTDLVAADFYHQYFPTTYNDVPITKEVIPRRINETGRIVIFPYARKSFYDRIINGISDGHFAYIHDPYELPIPMQSFPHHKKLDMTVEVEPVLIDIDDSVKELELKERNCYLENEKPLKLFKVYTKLNCEHECLCDYMISRCGCVEFFIIRNYTTRICSGVEKSCFDGARNDFDKDTCECLNPCTYVKYDLKFKSKNILPYANTHDTDDELYVSYLKIETKKPINSYLVRKKQFNVLDFLSFVGGLLGLFAGFSSLSLIEIFYWMFKKIIKVLQRRNRSIRPEIIVVVPVNSDEIEVSGSKPNNLAKEYFAESSIHGFNYLFISGIFETSFWLFAAILSISFCVVLISQTNEKLPDSRVVALDDNIKSAGKIPFPAITFQPTHVVDMYYKDNLLTRRLDLKYRQKLEKDPELKKKYIDYISKYCATSFGIPSFVSDIGIDPEDILLDLVRNASTIDKFVKQFATLNGVYAVDFAEVQVWSKKAFTFNLMHPDKLLYINKIGRHQRYSINVTITNQKDYPAIPKQSYPISMDFNDKLLEFKLKIQNETSSNFAIHQITELPNFIDIKHIQSFHQGYDLIAEVTPEITITDESLRKLSPDVRQCFFEDEKKLEYFKTYTEFNCQTECEAFVTFKTCGCVRYYQLFMNIPNMKYCHKINEMKCGFKPDLLSKNNTKNCNCLPDCNKVKYKIDYFATYNTIGANEGTLTVRMKTENAVLYRKIQQFTFSDELSYVGGLLGLFAGISMLSIVEVFYFFVFRLIINFWRSIRKGQ